MDAVPDSVDQAAVQAFLGAQPGVSAVHHLHIWALGSDEVAMTAHLVREDAGDHDAFIARVAHELDERFGIHHPTPQIERTGDCPKDEHHRSESRRVGKEWGSTFTHRWAPYQ